ncbi:hypothetical protein [Cellulomonas hominis]|uniref:hypothetical protein n=1 Tax=Cellulomonas hominis TaxID=156981 RepID=UPI001443EF3B|nr:hypothetical protein [Cellulomonas hominis]NKY11210.1 hypothetical protein [Cellulomonas hominis]
MSISSETRKRLWARSGNRCALCRLELIRDDQGSEPGALIGQEAHITARNPGGPRYEPVPVDVRDGYANLVLLCANDHVQVDAQPERYTVERLRALKQEHETWVRDRLRPKTPAHAEATRVVPLRSGDAVWNVMSGAHAYQTGAPGNLPDDVADLVDDALQVFVDCGEISEDITAGGLRAVRDAKRAIQAELDALASADLTVLGGRRRGEIAPGFTGDIAIVHVVTTDEFRTLTSPPESDAPVQ